MTAAVDPRIESVGQLLTARRLLDGHGAGLIRPHSIARLLGVGLQERELLLAWIVALDLWHEPPYHGPLADAPEAGTVDVDRLRVALQQAIAGPGLPFTAQYLQEPSK